MILGKAYFQSESGLKFPHPGPVAYGCIIPRAEAGPSQPFFYFSAPIQIRPTAVITCLPFPEGDFWKCDLLDFSDYKPVGQDSGEWSAALRSNDMVLANSELVNSPEPWIRPLLKRSQEYWCEFTIRPDASELWADFRMLSAIDQDALIGRRARKALRMLRQDLFICSQWETWTKHSSECGFVQFAEHCRQHGIDIAPGTLKIRGRRLKLPDMRSYRQSLEERALT